METKEKVLQAMREAGEPVNAGKIAELSGIDRKEVDKAMKQLNKLLKCCLMPRVQLLFAKIKEPK